MISYFFFRQIQFKDTPENKYQATLVWPQASKKPSTASLLTADELNQIMIRFAVAINQKPIGHQVIYLVRRILQTNSETNKRGLK